MQEEKREENGVASSGGEPVPTGHDRSEGGDEPASENPTPQSDDQARPAGDAHDDRTGSDSETTDSDQEDVEEDSPVVAREEYDKLATENKELKNDHLRALADVENIRKRSERERQEATRFGATRLARDLLTVHDNLKRALASASDEQRETTGAIMEGVELTLRELLSAFGRHGIKPVEPERGDAFDPNLHQAMFEAPDKEVPAGKILHVMTEGFTIHERLLRPAQVGISSGQPLSTENVEGAGNEVSVGESST